MDFTVQELGQQYAESIVRARRAQLRYYNIPAEFAEDSKAVYAEFEAALAEQNAIFQSLLDAARRQVEIEMSNNEV